MQDTSTLFLDTIPINNTDKLSEFLCWQNYVFKGCQNIVPIRLNSIELAL